MSRQVSQVRGLWEQKKAERRLVRDLRSASPRLREEYFAALRGLDS